MLLSVRNAAGYFRLATRFAAKMRHPQGCERAVLRHFASELAPLVSGLKQGWVFASRSLIAGEMIFGYTWAQPTAYDRRE